MKNPFKVLFSPEPRRASDPKRYHPVHRKWPPRVRKIIWYMFIVELSAVVPTIALFALSQPDLFRSDMWQIGWEHGYNSNPAMILYAYANHEPLPKIALVWTRTFTDFNVAISVISLFFFLGKLVAFIMKVWFPIFATFISLSMSIMYTVSIYGQIGPDYVDPRHPSPVVWYLRYGCSLAEPYGKARACHFAQACFGIAIYVWVVYLINLGLCIYTMLPNKINDEPDEDEDDYSTSDPKETQTWEMHSMKSPMGMSFRQTMPYTPRTQAFHTLDRQLPLRAQGGAMGWPTPTNEAKATRWA